MQRKLYGKLAKNQDMFCKKKNVSENFSPVRQTKALKIVAFIIFGQTLGVGLNCTFFALDSEI